MCWLKEPRLPSVGEPSLICDRRQGEGCVCLYSCLLSLENTHSLETCLASLTGLIFPISHQVRSHLSRSVETAQDSIYLDRTPTLLSGAAHSPVHHHLMHLLPVLAVIVRSHLWVQFLEGDSCHIHPAPHCHWEKSKTKPFIFLSDLNTDMNYPNTSWYYSQGNCLW